jgi:hypothetical protein
LQPGKGVLRLMMDMSLILSCVMTVLLLVR